MRCYGFLGHCLCFNHPRSGVLINVIKNFYSCLLAMALNEVNEKEAVNATLKHLRAADGIQLVVVHDRAMVVHGVFQFRQR